MQHALSQALQDLGLRGMARAYERSHQEPSAAHLSFEERLGLLIDVEHVERQNYRYAQRIRWAKLSQASASLEELDRKSLGLDGKTMVQLTDLSFIEKKLNVIIAGPTGVGKSYLACALAQAACKADINVRYLRLPRLLEELALAEALKKKSAFYKALSKAKLLVLDDFGLAPLTESQSRDLLEILDDRYDKSSTIVTSQLPVDHWHHHLGEPTLADAILDRLVHNAYKITLKGESKRKRKAQREEAQMT
jgi:DNA replication protein DnaC